MWKIPAFTMILATMLLGGCNWGNDNANQETPMEDVKNDVERGMNDVEDAVTPDTNNDMYNRDVNGVNENGTVNDNSMYNNGTTNDNNGTVNDNNVVPEGNNNNTDGTVKENNNVHEDMNK